MERLRSAIAHLQAGRLDAAEAMLRRVLDDMPGHPAALHYLARVSFDRGHTEDAAMLLEQALVSAPADPALHNSLGILYNALRRHEDAIAAFKQALRYQPDHFDACYNLATLECILGHHEESERYFRRCRTLRPNDWQICVRYGEMLLRHHQYAQAATWFQEALALHEHQPEVWHKLGTALRNLWRFREAEETYRHALYLKPDFSAAHSALLSMLGYHVLATPQRILEEHLAWDHAHGNVSRVTSHAVHRAGKKRRLRIGYVSPDLYRHAVSSFIEPLLELHDRRRVEVYCYAEVHNPDETTKRLQGWTDHWRSTVGLNDEEVARMILADKIDVLVDLAGHSHANRTRIRVFCYKPAPVQVTYLGYFTTTGLQTMDYWITDWVTCPQNTVERAVETIYRLPRCCVCYSPRQDAPAIGKRHAVGDAVTFGCFNNLGKVGPAAIEHWSRILRALPASRLILKAGQLADAGMRQRLASEFAQHGIDAGRISMLPYTDTQREHFALHNEIDIALDTMPRTGVTTTADALWMGVPVITLAGKRFIERLGVSLMTSIGLSDLIAGSPEEYVTKAVELARDDQRRMELRKQLRSLMADSPLCNGKDLAKTLEDAYHDMWERRQDAHTDS